jgi:3-hydroxy-D-aspartate aldolase
MLQHPPAEPGMREDEVETPALILDLDAFEANLATMARRLEGRNVALRPHAKTHKSPVIAHLQKAHGAVGQCVQKVGEAEALAWGGVTDILVTNEVVGARKLARLAALAHVATIGVCADHADQIDALDGAAAEAGARLTATAAASPLRWRRPIWSSASRTRGR